MVRMPWHFLYLNMCVLITGALDAMTVLRFLKKKKKEKLKKIMQWLVISLKSLPLLHLVSWISTSFDSSPFIQFYLSSSKSWTKFTLWWHLLWAFTICSVAVRHLSSAILCWLLNTSRCEVPHGIATKCEPHVKDWGSSWQQCIYVPGEGLKNVPWK